MVLPKYTRLGRTWPVLQIHTNLSQNFLQLQQPLNFLLPEPPPNMPPKRMTANPVKPARHRAGKSTGASDPDSDSDEAGDSDAESPSRPAEPPKKRTIAPPPRVSGPGRVISTGAAKPVIDDAARKAAAAKKLAEVERKAREEGFITESEGESDDDDEEGRSGEDASGSGSESASESEDEESSSEEETRRPVMVRPKFISKAKREQQAHQDGSSKGTTAAEPEEDEAAQRRAEADALVEAQIQKHIAARAAGKKHWDDSEESGDEVDDTDDVDPAAEYAAWRLREIKRIVRAREAIEAKEKELAEKERRQNLTEEERRAEDDALIAKQKEEKDGRGKMGYMQKYYHKGAFYQEESEKLGLGKRDLMGARFADDVKNRELLPQALQMRDMTKLGKKGATKYKDLKSEDTGQWGRFDDPRRQRSEWDRYGDGERRGGGDYNGKGANAMPLGERKQRAEQSGERDDRRGGDSWRRDRSRSRSSRRRDRSRSRSPRRYRDDDRDSRKRDYSRERDRFDDDKRRRVDTR